MSQTINNFSEFSSDGKRILTKLTIDGPPFPTEHLFPCKWFGDIAWMISQSILIVAKLRGIPPQVVFNISGNIRSLPNTFDKLVPQMSESSGNIPLSFKPKMKKDESPDKLLISLNMLIVNSIFYLNFIRRFVNDHNHLAFEDMIFPILNAMAFLLMRMSKLITSGTIDEFFSNEKVKGQSTRREMIEVDMFLVAKLIENVSKCCLFEGLNVVYGDYPLTRNAIRTISKLQVTNHPVDTFPIFIGSKDGKEWYVPIKAGLDWNNLDWGSFVHEEILTCPMELMEIGDPEEMIDVCCGKWKISMVNQMEKSKK